jgi:hypothetical protein
MGVGSINVDVRANTAKAVAGIKVFRDELKAAGRDASMSARDFERLNNNEYGLGGGLSLYPQGPSGGHAEAAALSSSRKTLMPATALAVFARTSTLIDPTPILHSLSSISSARRI